MLKKGYVPSWRSDDELFKKQPLEKIIFDFLLKQAHYKESPHCTKIEGGIFQGKGKKNLPYSKDWSIELGDVLTSKAKITKLWGITAETIKEKLLSLEKKGLIKILLQEPALIVRIVDFAFFAVSPDCEEERAPFSNWEPKAAKVYPIGSKKGGYRKSVGGVSEIRCNVTSSLTRNLTINLTRGGKRAHAKRKPPPIYQFNKLNFAGKQSQRIFIVFESSSPRMWGTMRRLNSPRQKWKS